MTTTANTTTANTTTADTTVAATTAATDVTKSCDGTFKFEEKYDATMCLTRNVFGEFDLKIISHHGDRVFYSEKVLKSHSPKFTSRSFYIRGMPIFIVEDGSTARFNEMKEFFDLYFETKYDYLIYNDNYYQGESKNGSPNGIGILYYGQTNNIMAKGGFRAGIPEGQITFYSRDQSIVLECDDVCNFKPVQYARLIFKNMDFEILVVDFNEINKVFPNLLKKSDIDTFVNTIAKYLLEKDKSIIDAKTFMFSNKNQQDRDVELYNLIDKIDKDVINMKSALTKSNKYFNYLLCFSFFGFLCQVLKNFFNF
jgi:hypothetical protein